jgi:hypothetical protein
MECLLGRLPDRIVAAGVEGVTADQPPDPEKDPSRRSVLADRRQGVLGAGRVKTATARQDGGDQNLIGSDESDKECL